MDAKREAAQRERDDTRRAREAERRIRDDARRAAAERKAAADAAKAADAARLVELGDVLKALPALGYRRDEAEAAARTCDSARTAGEARAQAPDAGVLHAQDVRRAVAVSLRSVRDGAALVATDASTYAAAGPSRSSSGASTTIASVVSTNPPMLAACSSAQRVTLTGSTMPRRSRSQIVPVRAS